jgi:hypothetical protein
MEIIKILPRPQILPRSQTELSVNRNIKKIWEENYNLIIHDYDKGTTIRSTIKEREYIDEYIVDLSTHLIVENGITQGFFSLNHYTCDYSYDCHSSDSNRYSIKNILLSYDADWIAIIKKIIEFCNGCDIKNDMIWFEIENPIIGKIIIDFFGGIFVPMESLNKTTHYCLFLKERIDKTFSNNLRMEFEIFCTDDLIKKHTTRFFVGHVNNVHDCGCVTKQKLLIFENPILDPDAKYDVFFEIKFVVNDENYYFDNFDEYTKNEMDKFYYEQMNFKKLRRNTSACENNDFEFITSIEISDKIKNNEKTYHERTYYERTCDIVKTKKCKSNSCKCECLSIKLDDDGAFLSKIIFDDLKLSSKKCTLKKNNKKFVINDSFIPNKIKFSKNLCANDVKKNDIKENDIKENDVKKNDIRENNDVDDEKQQEKSGFCYVIHLREFIKSGENVYKIGRTQQKKFSRFNGYPKDSNVCVVKRVNNCFACEDAIKESFNKMFKQRKDIGREYYEGKYDEIVKEFEKIANKFL